MPRTVKQRRQSGEGKEESARGRGPARPAASPAARGGVPGGGGRAPLPQKAIRKALCGLHDLHEAAGLVDAEVPLREEPLEFRPVDGLNVLVAALRELDLLRPADAGGLEALLAGDLARLLTAYGV